jgi:hypothetical protein
MNLLCHHSQHHFRFHDTILVVSHLSYLQVAELKQGHHVKFGVMTMAVELRQLGEPNQRFGLLQTSIICGIVHASIYAGIKSSFHEELSKLVVNVYQRK